MKTIVLLLFTQVFTRLCSSTVVGYHEEREALLKFRERVPDCLTENTENDEYLLRWLRVAKFDVDKAEHILRKSMEWRRQWKVDQLKDLELTDIFKRYFTYGLSGFDKEGAPVVIVPFTHLDATGLYRCVGREELITATLKVFEDFRLLAEKQALEFGPNAGKIVCIVDMTDFHFKLTYNEVGKLGKVLMEMLKDNYPEVMKSCFLLNATTSFKLAYRTMCGFLGSLKQHIKLFKPSEINYAREELLTLIDADQLPAYFGGTMTDPDGNPRCISKINYGGNISNEYQVESRLVDLLDKNYDQDEEKSELL